MLPYLPSGNVATVAGPLDGVFVVDASRYVTGPFAAMMLGDLGAEVVKVEPPGGDPNRRIGRRRGGIGMLFVNTNRGKRSAVLDLKEAADAVCFRRLLKRADVLVENWRPGVPERLGLSDGPLAAMNPRLVHLAITGYGPTGPRSARGAFDSLAQALSGLAWFQGEASRPRLLRTYVADKATSTLAVQAVLAALFRRERTGRGGRVEVNMLDASAYFNFPDLFDARTILADAESVDPADHPGDHTLIRTADGWIVVAPSTRNQVERACRAAGHPEWVEELAGLTDFRQLAPALMSRIEGVTRAGPTAAWLAAFDAADVPAAPVLDLDAHLSDPQVAHNHTYGELDHPRLGPHRYARYPARFTGESDRPTSHPFPELDEHGEEIRSRLEAERSAP